MRATFFTLLLGTALLQVSCGGEQLEPDDQIETPAPDLLEMTTWPDAVDLGVVVSSGIDPSVDAPPPPDFVR